MIAELLSPAAGVLVVPFATAITLALVRSHRAGGWLNLSSCAVTACLAVRLRFQYGAGELLLVDPLSVHMAMLTTFVAFTSAWFSLSSIGGEVAEGRLDHSRIRHYHALFQLLLGAMLLALLSSDIGVAWIALELATLGGAVAVALRRTPEAIAASRRSFIACAVGIALALFGSVMLAAAAIPLTGPGLPAMDWTALAVAGPRMRAMPLNLAFVFLLLGYGTKAALVPLHGWMPEALAESPTPLSPLLAVGVPGVALVLLLRLRGVLTGNAEAIAPGPPLMALGLASVLLAAFSLWRQPDARRFFALASIGQTGIVAFALGLGGVGASFAAMLHLTVHTLAMAALFQCLGHAARSKDSQRFSEATGLLATSRPLGLTLAATILAVAAMPPFGLFTSEFLVMAETLRLRPALAAPLGVGLVVGAWALIARLVSFRAVAAAPGWTTLIPAWLHLALAAMLGLAMPAEVAAWFDAVARVAR